mgnify:CR=1 FL=1
MDNSLKNRKFVRYSEGAKIYGMCERKFVDFAKDANAIYKIDRLVLVNTEKIDQYLESFHVDQTKI